MKCVLPTIVLPMTASMLMASVVAVDASKTEYRLGAPLSQSGSRGNHTYQIRGTLDQPLPQFENGGTNLHAYSDELRAYIIEAHNRARAELVPTEAANMRQMQWSEQLAIEASELVETCVFEHVTEGYGQNLVYGGGDPDKTQVDSWMDMWVTGEISDSDREGTGYMELNHASAVLWAKSYLVGCASKMCDGLLTACNYYSPGNYVGEQTYVPGTPCSQCPTEAPYCDATGKLCASEQSGEDESGTLAPEKPADTPAPYSPEPEPEVTPAPVTPELETPTPETPEPDTPEPETLAPETPEPETPEPETPELETPEPETPEQRPSPEPEDPTTEGTPEPETPTKDLCRRSN